MSPLCVVMLIDPVNTRWGRDAACQPPLQVVSIHLPPCRAAATRRPLPPSRAGLRVARRHFDRLARSTLNDRRVVSRSPRAGPSVCCAVIPACSAEHEAQAGIHAILVPPWKRRHRHAKVVSFRSNHSNSGSLFWIPACAGMTVPCVRGGPQQTRNISRAHADEPLVGQAFVPPAGRPACLLASLCPPRGRQECPPHQHRSPYAFFW